MIRTFLLSILLIGAFIVAPTTPAEAACYGNRQYNCSGWDEVADEESVAYESWAVKWSYHDYDLNCLEDPDGTEKAIQIIVAYPDTMTSSESLVASNIGRFRELIRRIASIYGASTSRVYPSMGRIDPENMRINDYSPRFLTNGLNSNGVCLPKLSYEAFPQATLDGFPASTGGIYDQLIARGYNDPNRKYLVVHQSNCFDGAPAGSGCDGWGGSVYDATASDPNPATNPNNQGGARTDFFSAYLTKNYSNAFAMHGEAESGYGGMWRRIYVVAHEMAHNLGAVPPAAPHGSDTHIVGDGRDLMQYSGGDTTRCPEQRKDYRLDCGDDDYFSFNHKAWESSRWNIANSDYLWHI